MPVGLAQHFESIQKLGEGSFGEVHLAMDRRNQRRVALKFLRFDPSTPNFHEAVALFKREFELLRELKHPHLASVFDFGFDEEQKRYFFSAEFCPGKDLAEAFAGRSVEFFEDALVQILSALDYIHSQGVVHSDIKPANVLVEERDGAPFIKLLDFGVAGRLRSSGQGVGGTPAYMAPELWTPGPKLDPRSDLYSLGVLCLELLGGGLPFDVENQRSIQEWHLRGSIPEHLWQAREIPTYLRELIEKLLAKKPSDRFSNARVVLNFLNLGTSGKYQSAEIGLQTEIPLEGPLIERKEVCEGIQRVIQSGLQPEDGEGAPGVFFLCGERGIGKSRVLEEIRLFLAVHEIRSHSVSGDWEIPSWPRLAETLGLPPLANDNLDETWQVRRRVDSLREVAKAAPLCILIDDFHKIDRDLKQTILKLSEESQPGKAEARVPLFVVVASEENVEGGITLKRLSRQGVLQYVQHLLGKSDKTEGLADILFRYSGGLPLLVAEGLRYLAPRFNRGESLDQLLPSPHIASLYREKMQALTAPEIELLHLTALLFRPVPESELLQILHLTSAELDQLARNSLRSGLLTSRTEMMEGSEFAPIYQMSSQALAIELIEGLDPERRRSLHQAIAEGMEKSGKAPKEEFAYHLAKAGKSEDAARCYEEAAASFQAAGLVSSATRCLSKAMQLLPEGSPHWQEVTTELTRLFIVSGAYREAEDSLQKLSVYPSWKGEELSGWLAFKKRDFPVARHRYEKALQLLPPDQEQQKILLENALGNVDLHDGHPAEAVARFQKSLLWEQALPAEEQLKINNNNLGIALAVKGDHEAALEFYAERARRLEGRLKPDQEIALLNGRSYVCLQSGRFEEAITYLKRAMQLAEQSGALHPFSSIMGNLITALIKESRYAESLPLLQKILAFQERLGNHRDVAYNLLRQGSVYLTLGMGEKAKSCFQGGRAYLDESDKNLFLWYSLVDGYWEKEYGNQDRAMELFREMEQGAETFAIPEIQSWAVYAQADLAFEQKKHEVCRALLTKIQATTQDKEFLARLHLLEAKIAAFEKGEDPEKLFAKVENECVTGHYREILWELYHDWGLAREKRQGPKAAIPLLEQGAQIVEAIVGSLPEEYRDRYLNQKMRKKLFQDLEHSRTVPIGGMASRIKGFFKEKLSRSSGH